MADVVINISKYNVLISACDLERVLALKWKKRISRGGYVYFISSNGLLLHRFIIDCPQDKVADHINHDTLDNRRENLRQCTRAENCRNSVKPKHNTSGFKGVTWDKEKNKWKAHISVDSREIHLGYFESLGDAYEKYIEASNKYHGEFGRVV